MLLISDRNRGRATLAVMVAACLAGCASPKDRVAGELVRAGLAEPAADCLAGGLTDELSIAQLRELAAAIAMVKRQRGPDAGPVTARDVLSVAAQIDDPRIPAALARAGAGCVLG